MLLGMTRSPSSSSGTEDLGASHYSLEVIAKAHSVLGLGIPDREQVARLEVLRRALDLLLAAEQGD
jgi:hypothetical protein